LWLLSVRTTDRASARLTKDPSLAGILGWLLALEAIDLGVHALAVRDSWLPLAGKVVVSVLGIAGVCRWLTRATRGDTTLPRRDFLRGFAVLAVLVVTINVAWHYFRAWLPLILQKQHDYSEHFTNRFMLCYYVATDLGSLSVGFATLWLSRRLLSVHASRVVLFLVCALLTTLSIAAAVLPTGPVLLGVFLVIGFAALG